jgi:hypothetical protein
VVLNPTAVVATISSKIEVMIDAIDRINSQCCRFDRALLRSYTILSDFLKPDIHQKVDPPNRFALVCWASVNRTACKLLPTPTQQTHRSGKCQTMK